MSKHGTWILAALAALALVAGPAVADPEETPQGATYLEVSAPVNLLDVEVGNEPDGRPSVSLDVDGWVEYDTLVLENPDRLVVNLDRAVYRLEDHLFEVGREGVTRVRAGQFRGGEDPISRIVFDLERQVSWSIDRRDDGLVVVFGGEPASAAAAEPEIAQPEVAETDSIEETAPAVPAMAAVPVVVPVPEEVMAVAEAEPAIEAEAEAPVVARVEVPEERRPVAEPRAIPSEAIERLLREPELAAETPEPEATSIPAATFATKKIVTDEVAYTGKRISLNLVDADIKQVFRLFHEISGLNFVLDPRGEGGGTIDHDHVPWDQALDIILKNNGLDKVLENNVIRIASTQKLASEAAARKQLKEAKELEVEPVTITRTLSYAKARDVERVIREGGVLTQRGRVIVDERTNTLIISDIPKKVEPVDVLISTLDSETPQVMIEARIVETSKQFVQDFGVSWGFDGFADSAHGTATSLEFPHNASARYGLNLPGAGTASTLSFSFGNVLDSFTLDVALSTLETEGRGRILSSPKIATQNNERAEIEQGVRIPVVNTTATEINVEFVSASLRLQVTPQITAEGTVILDINVENNTPDFVNRVGDVPPINTQRAQTKVLIGDGGTAVIGGIFTVNEGSSETGVPWFRKVPVLGWLFKTRNVTKENRELLIFITPKIMKIG